MSGDQTRGAASFVVRSKGAWWHATIHEPARPLTADELQRQLRRPRRRFGRDRAVGLAHDVVVEPVATVVGQIRDGRLEVVGAVGPTRLDSLDVRLLDRVSAPVSVTVVSEGEDPVVSARRLAGLVEAGLIRQVRDGSPVGGVGPAPSGPATEPPAEATSEPGTDRSGTSPGDGRIPVYAVWPRSVGPLLSLGMLTASARQFDGGALNEQYEIRAPETAESFLAAVRLRPGPGVLLCSDYVFTLDENIAAARAALAINPELVVIHGGPSSPKRGPDAAAFLDTYGDVAHVLVRGEGEGAICEILEALAPTLPRVDVDALAHIPGLTVPDPDGGEPLRTPDRERLADLDSLPSPYLTGEFDHIPPDQWVEPPHFETNRGCPYGCTFCDWGSATQSRIRKFDLDRLRGEFEWAMAHGLSGVYLCDANFGILPRDVDIAEALAELKQRYGAPQYAIFTPAKNTIRHLARILDVLTEAGVATAMSISLQTTDPETLEVVGRKNISTDAYLGLAADLRRRGHALTGDVILGLPGQSYESYKADLQFFLDHEIMPRTFPLRVLPNAPMNDPEYRDLHEIRIGDQGAVLSSATMPPADRDRAWRLRKVEAIAERYGVLRHLMRYLQWDCDVAATEVLQTVIDLSAAEPEAWPNIAWLFEHYDRFPAPPLGWRAFYGEVQRLVTDRLGVPDSSALRTAFAVQEFLMPVIGREFPATLDLDHDYVAYFQDATIDLYRSGHAGLPPRPLQEYPAGRLTITADPLGLCSWGIEFVGAEAEDGGDPVESDFYIGAMAANELDSPLLRLLPRLALEHDVVTARVAATRARVGDEQPDRSSVSVSIGRMSSPPLSGLDELEVPEDGAGDDVQHEHEAQHGG